jgi:hypothetical protein
MAFSVEIPDSAIVEALMFKLKQELKEILMNGLIEDVLKPMVENSVNDVAKELEVAVRQHMNPERMEQEIRIILDWRERGNVR